MNLDIRLPLHFLQHPKTFRLEDAFGAEGILSLIRLWMWAAENRPDGRLTGADERSVERIAQFTGEKGAFFRLLIKDGWIKADADGVFTLAEWAEHQPYASKSAERHEKALKAARSRWHRDRDADPMPPSMPTRMPLSNAPKHQDAKNTGKRQAFPLTPLRGYRRGTANGYGRCAFENTVRLHARSPTHGG